MANDAAGYKRLGSPLPPPQVDLDGSGEIDLRPVFELLWAVRWQIAAITFSAFMFGVLFCVLVPPKYQADGLVQIEQQSAIPGGAGGGTGGSEEGGNASDLLSLLTGAPLETQGEIQVLQSRMVLKPVVDSLNLTVTAEPRHFPVIGGAVARWNSKSPAPVGAPPLLGSFAWGGERIDVGTLDVPADWVGKKLKLVRTEAGFTVLDPDGAKVLNGKVGETATTVRPEGVFSILVNDLVARPGTQFELKRKSLQAVFKELLDRLEVKEQGKQSGVIAVTIVDHSASFAQKEINSLEDGYLSQNIQRRSANARQSLDFLQQQLPDLKKQLDQAQSHLNAYQLKHHSVDVLEETHVLVHEGADLEAKRLELTEKRNELLQMFTPEHPAVKAVEGEIRSMDAAEDQLKERGEKLPDTQQDVLGLMRDLEVSSKLYAQMLSSIQELEVTEAGTVGNVRIVDYAQPPLRPLSPNVPQVLGGCLLAGLLLGAGFVFVRRALLRGIDDPSEFESRLGLVTYAMIPFSPAEKKLQRGVGAGKRGNFILAATDSGEPAVEAIRSLRTSLHFAMVDAPNNVLMLTGPTPGLGKSFVSLNLGTVLAQSGKRPVIVDCDLRRGHLNRYVSAQSSPGISEYVVGNAALADIVRSSPVANLDLVFRGQVPPNPAELLLHERFAALINRLSASYDIVIVDTPPVLAVADAAIVGRLAGSTILVLKSAEHSLREVQEALKRLATAGVHVKGALLNQVGAKAGTYGYRNYGYRSFNYQSRH